jgi:hypothetical protein
MQKLEGRFYEIMRRDPLIRSALWRDFRVDQNHEQNNYRLIFSRVRGMLIAVEETASASGNAGQGEAVSVTPILHVLA